jgi:hypothetical protein
VKEDDMVGKPVCSLGREEFRSHQVPGVILVIGNPNKRGRRQFEAEVGNFDQGYKARHGEQKRIAVMTKVDFVKFLLNVGYTKGEVVAVFKALESEGLVRGMA